MLILRFAINIYIEPTSILKREACQENLMKTKQKM